MKLGRSVFILLACLALVACSPIKSFKEMTEKQDEYNALSLQRIGVEAQVGWNITNGTLTRVSVMYPSGTLSSKTLGEIESTVMEMVVEVFGEQPQLVTIGINVISK